MSYNFRTPFNPVIPNIIQMERKVKTKVSPLLDQTKIINDWQQYIIVNKDAKVDMPVSFNFTKEGRINIGYSYSDTKKEFTILDEALSFIRNFIKG